jgi:hypothetical protein
MKRKWLYDYIDPQTLDYVPVYDDDEEKPRVIEVDDCPLPFEYIKRRLFKCPVCKVKLTDEDLHVEDGFGICPYCENEFELEGSES